MTATPPSANGNGKARATLFPPSQQELQKKRATQNPTRHYHPSGGNWYGYGTQALDGRPIFTWFDIPRMMNDPQVIFISQLWRAPFQKVQFTVKANSPAVAAFVQNTIKRFWRASLPKLLSRFFKYGFCAGGAEYESRQGWLRLARVKAVENRDVEPRVWRAGERAGEFAGFRLQNSSGIGAATEFVGSPHAFYFAGHGEYSPFYGWPPLAGLFAPWLEKNGRGGAIHLRRVWFRKNANRGKILRYPPGTSVATEENPQGRENVDLAREILDYGESNSTYAFENTLQPGNPDKYEWDMEDDHPQGDVAGFLDYPKELDEEMVKGAGIPLEVIQGSDSGSGYKGRLVSYGGFLGTVDELTGLILEGCDPWLAPLVAINYGSHAWYEVEPVSLAQIASEEEKRQPTNPVGQSLASLPSGGGGSGSPASQFQAEGVKTSAPLPFELSALDYDDAAPDRPVYYRFGLESDPFRDFDPQYGVALVHPTAPVELSATGETNEFGCAMILLPPTLADQVRALAAKIPDSALADKGREDSPHVTVRWGFPGAISADDLRPILADSPPVRIRLGAVSVFPGAASGKDYDVVKFDVDSAGLRRLNRELAVLPHTDTHKVYSPHVTICYVKAGLGQSLAALAAPLAAEFTAKSVTYSPADGPEAVIPLGGSVEMSSTSTSDDMDPKVKEQVFNQTQQKLMRTRKSTIAQLLALAMLRKQQSATAAGKPGEAAGSLQALSQLAGDPIQVARIVGMREMSATDAESFEMAWTAFTTAKGGIGAVSDSSFDQAGKPRKLYGKRAEDALGAHDRRQEKQGGVETARAALQKLYAGTADFNDVIDLSNSVGHLTLKEVNEARTRLETVHGVGTGKRGERVKEQRINALLSYVDEKMAEAEAKKPKPSGAQVGPEGEAKTLLTAPDHPPASGVAVVTPEGVLKTDPVDVQQQDQAAEPVAPETIDPVEEVASGLDDSDPEGDARIAAARESYKAKKAEFDKNRAKRNSAGGIDGAITKALQDVVNSGAAPSDTGHGGMNEMAGIVREKLHGKFPPDEIEKAVLHEVAEGTLSQRWKSAELEKEARDEGADVADPDWLIRSQKGKLANGWRDDDHIEYNGEKLQLDAGLTKKRKDGAAAGNVIGRDKDGSTVAIPVSELPQHGNSDAAAPAPAVTPNGRKPRTDPNDSAGSPADAYFKDVGIARKLPADQRDKKIRELRAAFLKATEEQAAGPLEDVNPEDGPVPEGDAPLLDLNQIADPEPAPDEPVSRSHEPDPPDALVQKANRSVAALTEAIQKNRSPKTVELALKQAKEHIAALPPAEQAKFRPDLLPESARGKVKSAPVFSPEEMAAELAKVKVKPKPVAPAPVKTETIPENEKPAVADKVAEKLAAEPVKANPEKRPTATAKKAKKVPKSSPHVAAVQKVADGVDDPVAKDYLEAAIHNHRNGTASDIAGALGRSVEEDYTAHTGESIKRDVPPDVRAAVEKALTALGAKPEGNVGDTVKYDSLRYEQPPDPEKENWFTDDPVRLVRAPFTLNGDVVAKGKVKSVK